MFLSTYKKKTSLYIRKKNNAGRNNTGRITVAHQGGGHKQLYRKITFKDNLLEGTVIGLEYDPNRTSHIAKICYYNTNNQKNFYYIIAPKNLKVLDVLKKNDQDFINIENNFILKKQIGNFYYLNEFSIGEFIYNIEINPNTGAKLIRAAGTYGQILQKTDKNVLIKLPSGEHRWIPNNCKACYGIISNSSHKNRIIQKAGRSRWLNIRPTVRGVAMNPIDHPHGGNTGGGKPHMTPWSRLTKGKPTRNKKKINKNIIRFHKNKN